MYLRVKADKMYFWREKPCSYIQKGRST